MYSIFLVATVVAAPQGHGPDARLDVSALTEFRSVNGIGNNLSWPLWGSAGASLRRMTPPAYADGVGSPAGGHRSSARLISNRVVAQSISIPNARNASDFVWQWGQFLDHDIDETPVASPAEPFDIPVPRGDLHFDPLGLGGVTIPFSRSFRTSDAGIGEQVNLITSYIDASNVYGSDAERALALRTLDGSGKLKTSEGNLLPFNVDGLPNAPSNSATYFLAGDFRANEQVGLTAMHTLFVREHNYWAERIASSAASGAGDHHGGGAAHHGSPDRRALSAAGHADGAPTDDQIYELARAIVAAEMQSITYREFLPVVLGPDALAPYAGYRADVDATIMNEFATAAYRFGHSMLSPTLLRVDANGSTIPAGDLSLAESFFNPEELRETGIDPILRGLARQRAQAVDNFVIDEVRNFLFGAPGAGGFDLPALNIQRGRDHGLGSYNETRAAFGLERLSTFAEMTTTEVARERLMSAYRSVDDVDLWVGALCESPLPGALVGETIHTILSLQFAALRDGDRFWYENDLPYDLIALVEAQTLDRILRRNTSIGMELSNDVFRVAP